jgi:hypothetical protein
MTIEVQEREPTTTTAGPQPPHAAAWPLFYRKPELLSTDVHAQWRIKPAGVAFAAASNSVPLMIGEFDAAARHYPIVFAGPEYTPVAVLGLEQRNQFVDGDAWRQDTYVPAYVRRYPFVFAEVDESDGYALAIDAEAPMVATGGEEGQPLFEGGTPTELTTQALRFCEAFTRESAATQAFVGQLAAEGLLIERTANITLPEGGQSTLTGFSVVSPEAFAQLSEQTVVDWHRNGALARVHSHLLSLTRFADLRGN